MGRAAAGCRGPVLAARRHRPPSAAAAHRRSLPHWAAHLLQPAGAEFFRRRLQRALAVPPEQRDPAVHAFVTSVQLLNAADELLPLTPAGEPALPADSLAGQQAEVQALLLHATAAYIAPFHVEWEGRPQGRLGLYASRRLDMTAGHRPAAAYPPALQPLGGLLLMLHYCNSSRDPGALFSMRVSAWRQALPARSAIRRQLEEQQQGQQAQRGRAQPLLTLEQLEAMLCTAVADGGQVALLGWPNRQLPASIDVQDVVALVLTCCERLLELDPANPKALIAASSSIMVVGSPNPTNPALRAGNPQLIQRAVALVLRAFRAAQPMGSPYWRVQAGSLGLAMGILPGSSLSRADLAALVAAAEEAPAAVKPLRGMLPHAWVAELEQLLEGAAAALPAARLQLWGPSGQAAAVQAAASAVGSFQEQQASWEGRLVCSGCGTYALGLRRCARCKQAACE